MSESDDLVEAIKMLGYEHDSGDYWEFDDKELYKIIALVEPVIRSKERKACIEAVKTCPTFLVGERDAAVEVVDIDRAIESIKALNNRSE